MKQAKLRPNPGWFRPRTADLPALARAYAAGRMTWRQFAARVNDPWFGDLLLELGRQGLQLPRFVAAKTPAQQATFDAVLAAAKTREASER